MLVSNDMVLYECESMMMGVATNVVAVRQTLISSIVSNNSHCHPADSIFDTNILLSHAICPSLCRYGLVTKKIVSACIDYIIAAAVPCPWTGCCRNLKPRKLIEGLFGLSMKISPHENYPPCGSTCTCRVLPRKKFKA